MANTHAHCQATRRLQVTSFLAVYISSFDHSSREIKYLKGRPFVISASGSLDMVDLHGVGGLPGTIRDQSRGRGSISYHPTPLARPKS